MPRRIWFYGPRERFNSFSPIALGLDEYGRSTIVIGWPITGQIVIAYSKPNPELALFDYTEHK